MSIDCKVMKAELVEFETKTRSRLTVTSPGQSPRGVTLEDVDAWLREAKARGLETGWVPKAESKRAKAQHAQKVAEDKLARHVSRVDGLEKQLGPDWVKRLVAQRDNAIRDYKAACARAESNVVHNRALLADVSSRLCNLVTIASGAGHKRFAHFLGLTGCEFDNTAESGQEAIRVRNEIHKIVFAPVTANPEPRTPTRDEIERDAVSGAIRYLLGQFEIDYVETGDPIEFARYTLNRKMVP